MKEKNNHPLIWVIAYTLLIYAMCLSFASFFHSFYFVSIYIEGNSMNPTLIGNIEQEDGANFGITDTHKARINRIKRFDIVTCYFPWKSSDYENYGVNYTFGQSLKETAEYKIKRVIGLPGDTFRIEENTFYLKNNNVWEEVELPFERNISGSGPKDVAETTLSDEEGKEEYWVLGDNWSNSLDCGGDGYGSPNGPIYKENIDGVLVAIEGTCLVTTRNGKKVITHRHYRDFRTF